MSNLIFPKFPPNNAVPTIIGPTSTIGDIQKSLRNLGLSAPQQIPKKWDWRKGKNQNSEHDILLQPSNQLACGDCWAQSSTNALTDKFVIFKDISGLELNQLMTTICVTGKYSDNCKVQASTEQQINKECGGSIPFYAGKFFELHGVSQGKSSKNCPSWQYYCSKGMDGVCGNGKDVQLNLPHCNDFAHCGTLYKAKPCSTKTLTVTNENGQVDLHATINHIKAEILRTGPVVGTFEVFGDFEYCNHTFRDESGNVVLDYHWNATDGIYVRGAYDKDMQEKLPQLIKKTGPLSQKVLGWHAVEVVGWDETGNIPYWIVKNSWGPNWNKDGYWYHAMSTSSHNNCSMDIPAKFSEVSGEGGCTNFELDINSGDGHGKKVGPAPSGGNNKSQAHKIWIIIGTVIGGLLIIALIYYVYYRIVSKNKANFAFDSSMDLEAVGVF